MKLSNRLNALSNLIDNGSVVADIGCDHAHLCIHLVLHDKCKKAYACDINEGPLKQAQRNIQYYKVSEKVELCLSNGLDNVSDEVTTVVIAGMGFETIQKILDSHEDKLKKDRIFIIQSNTDVEKMRLWISNHQFKIISECVVKEDQHYYQMIKFVCNEDKRLDTNELYFGRKMNKDFTFYSLWKFRLSKLEKILKKLSDDNEKYDEVLSEMVLIYKEFGS